MSHPLVLALYSTVEAAAAGAGAVRELGVSSEDISVVARSHEEEGEIAEQIGGTPGADMEDSWLAARLGQLSAHVLAAMAVVLPGIGPIVASGPLSAGLGEAAGHVAGDLSTILSRAGVDNDRANHFERAVKRGAVLIGAHVRGGNVAAICQALEQHGGTDVTVAEWRG
jgi:hypothetical protein